MKDHRKKLKHSYKESPRPMGVFQIRNLVYEKVFVASGLDLPGIMNRHRFQLTSGIHQNLSLQADWKQLGGYNFAFEIHWINSSHLKVLSMTIERTCYLWRVFGSKGLNRLTTADTMKRSWGEKRSCEE
jgi:hypothetical protein